MKQNKLNNVCGKGLSRKQWNSKLGGGWDFKFCGVITVYPSNYPPLKTTTVCFSCLYLLPFMGLEIQKITLLDIHRKYLVEHFGCNED